MVNPAIKSAKDLEGKAIGMSRPRSADHGYTLVILERLGIDPRKVTFLSTGGYASRATAVEAGTTVGSSFNRYYMLQLKRKGFRDLARLNGPTIPSRRRSLSSGKTRCRANAKGSNRCCSP